MSCFNNNCYLPQPPRAWSRVQNSCSLITDSDNNSLVRDPYTGQLVPAVVLAERISMLNKGNVLQYKANSSNLTKVQKYSKIAKGQWVNRNTTWATQSTRGYTNPNTTSLKRSGDVVNVAIDPITGTIIGPTAASPTCLKPVTPTDEGLPSNVGESGVDEPPPIPPPVPPTPGSDTFPAIIPDTPVEPIVIQDGGSLICSVQEDPCTGETKSSLSQQLCHPTTDSDVPGPIQDLCWNDGTQTWYPRSRYVMTNSTNKWPVNAELFSAIQINSPYITSITSNKNIVTLTWTFNESCLSASNFNIFQDGNLVKSVPGNIFTTEVIVSNCNDYQYYIVAENITAHAISEASNIVNIQVSTELLISGCLYTIAPNTSVILNIIKLNNICNVINYIVYYTKDGITINNVTISSVAPYIVDGLNINENYSFYVKAILANGYNTNLSNTILINTTYKPFTYTNAPIIPEYYDSTNKIWSIIFNTTSNITFIQNINSTVFTTILGGGGGGGDDNITKSATGGEGGYQAVNSFNVINGSIFSISSIGTAGNYGSAGSGGSAGGNTSFTGPDSGTYTVTGGFPGQTSGGQVSGASYSGPIGTNIYTGSGGYGGGPWSETCSNISGNGNSSYLNLNQSLIQQYTGINILTYFNSTYVTTQFLFGGGGATGGTIGGVGGSQIGNGSGGLSSCSINLDTQDGLGYGAGGGGYSFGSVNLKRAGNGSSGIFILFFKYPTC